MIPRKKIVKKVEKMQK